MRIPFLTHSASLKRLLALTGLFAVAASLQAQPKIATVNLQNVFTNYFKTKQADSLLQEHGAEADKVLKGWLDDYQKANEDYKKLVEGANDQAVAAEERDKRKKAAETKATELNAKAPPGVLTSGSKEEKPAVSQPKTDEKPPEPVKPATPTTKQKKK